MKPCVVAAVIIANALACSPAYADDVGLRLETIEMGLQNIEKQLDLINVRMEDLTKDMKEMKQCSALARQPPLTLAELRETVKPSNKQDDLKLVELYKQDMSARMKCGLSPK